MANDNSCLKCLCITFSVIYGILGCVTVAIGILVASFQEDTKDVDTSSGIIFFIVTGSLVVLLAILGFYGAYKEKNPALRVYVAFLVFHAIGCFKALHFLHQTEINDDAMAGFKQLTPLNEADPKIQTWINKLQTTFECCGLLSYEDWEASSIPQSCHCPPDYEDRVSKCYTIQPSRNPWAKLGRFHNRDAVEVYKEPCGPIILSYLKMGITFVTGLFVTFLIVLVISAILHLMLTCQIHGRL